MMQVDHDNMFNFQHDTETERLTIRPVAPTDAGFLFALMNSEGWLTFIGQRNIHSPDDALLYIEQLQQKENFYYWTVTLTDSGARLGIVSFLKRAYLDHFDIGFAFLPQYHRKGYAFEATHAILSRLTSHPQHQTILASTVPTNDGSLGLLKKLGFGFDRELQINNGTLLIYSKTTPTGSH